MRLKRSSIWMKIVILAMIVYATVLLANTRAQIAEAKREQALLQEQVEETMRENAELEYDIEHAGDPQIIEEIARAKLGLVKPGEKIFYDISN